MIAFCWGPLRIWQKNLNDHLSASMVPKSPVGPSRLSLIVRPQGVLSAPAQASGSQAFRCLRMPFGVTNWVSTTGTNRWQRPADLVTMPLPDP